MEKAPASASGTLMWQVAGIVEAPPDRVAALLLDVRPGEFGPEDAPLILNENRLPTLSKRMKISGGPRQFTASWEDDPKGVYVIVDRAQGSVTIQGHWWYRGTYRIEAASQGSRLILDVYNIAPGLTRLLVPLVSRSVRDQQQPTFVHLLGTIGRRLGCAAYPANP